MKRIALAVSFVLLSAVIISADEFPQPRNTEPDAGAGPMPAEQAAAAMKLPPGFKCTVFAAEPEVQNPIAMSWDARGRLWIAENYTYAERGTKFDLALRDRVIILSDKDGDGRCDERKVFTDDVQMLTSVEVGLGGVWLMCPPQVLFIPDRNGDDEPDGKPEVVLDGFTVPPENYHNFANGLRFGPDGWLYGRCGASAPGELGAPGTPPEERIPMRGGIWRYSPRTKVVEALTSGTTNPWGHDWDAHGELFYINTVNGHLWHMMPGAHFVRPHTIDPNPHVYQCIDTHADHWHFDTGKDWSKSRDGAANEYGGGHAHSGAMIYLGGAWPKEYTGRLFTWNLHGRRANQERLDRVGSGYVGRHEPDFCLVSDPWFRGMELSYGPDGQVYALDWSDTGECHESTGVHRTSGRVYRIAYEGKDAKPEAVDLRSASETRLVDLMYEHPNEWLIRQARLELSRRKAGGDSMLPAMAALGRQLDREKPTKWTKGLRAFWTLSVIDGFSSDYLTVLLTDVDEHVRAWSVRLLTDNWPLDTMMSHRPASAAVARPPEPNVLLALEKLAKEDPSPLVRLALASTLQRLPVDKRVAIAVPLLRHTEDADDHNLPLMIWYGLIPLGESHPAELANLAAGTKWPVIRRHIARRLAEDIDKRPRPLDALIVEAAIFGDRGFQSDVVAGISEALAGWHRAKQPIVWPKLVDKLRDTEDATVRDQVRDLSAVFGDGRALDEVRRVALDGKAELTSRKAALQTLVDARPPDLRKTCEQLLTVRFLNPVAARGLALFDEPKVADMLVKAYRQFHNSDRPQLMEVLTSRPSFAKALLVAVAEQKIPREALSASVARQIHSFGNEELQELLTKTWGEFRDSPAEKKAQAAKLKQQLTPETLATADRSAGRALFNKTCAACHKLFGEGTTVGPDLTGANRGNIDYLLENIVDPSAVVTADFRLQILVLNDGRIFSGLVTAKTDRTLTLRTATESVTIDREDVEEQRSAPLSLMPDNQLQPMTDEQLRDLFAYLMGRTQVPLPEAQ